MADGRADNDLNKKATLRSMGFPIQKVFQQRLSYQIHSFGHDPSHYGFDPPAPTQIVGKEGPSKLRGFPSGQIGSKRDQGGTTGAVSNFLRGNLKINHGIDSNQQRGNTGHIGGNKSVQGASVNPTRNSMNPKSPTGELTAQVEIPSTSANPARSTAWGTVWKVGNQP